MVFLMSALCVITASAISAGISLTLESSQPVDEQLKGLGKYISQLPQTQQDEWIEGLRGLVDEKKVIYSDMAPIEDADTVYISGKGEKYHRSADCRGLRTAENIYAVTKDVAIEMGKTPCKFCYPHGDR